MNNLIKYIFLILTIMVNNGSYSQEQNYLKTIRIELKNSIGESIENAKILIDSVEIKYDTLTKGYFGSGQFSNDFTIEVTCKGYEKLTYNKKDLPFDQNSTDFVARLYLSKSGDKYYYYTPHFRVPYHPHSDELLVVLKNKESIISENSISEFENSIKKQGLIIYKTFLEMLSPDSKEYMKYRSLSPSIRRQVIVKKEDGSAFDPNSCTELAFLRQLEQVEYAGPLILMNNSYYDAFTYDHFIRLDYPLKSIDGAALNKLLKGIDERYFFDEKNYRIVLPLETNENVPQIMEKIYESGFSEPLYMSVMKFKQKQSNIDPKTISQLNSSDTLKHDSFIYGGEKVAYIKAWNRIGIVFESNYSDHSIFTKKI